MLLRGRWLVGHVLVLGMAALFVALGFWQLDRHREKREERREAQAALAAPAPDLLDADSPTSGTRVSVRGGYDPDEEVLLRNRVRDGESGFEVLTPVRLADGTGVVVNRGWIPRAAAERASATFAPPRSAVEIRGVVREPRPLRSDDTVARVGDYDALPRVDLDHIGGSLGYELRPVWLVAQFQDPAPAPGAPALPEPEVSSRVSHLSYAVQWFGLALVPLVGWPIVLGRVRRRQGPAPAADPGDGNDRELIEASAGPLPSRLDGSRR